MSMFGTVLKTAVALLFCLTVADVGGVIACSIADIVWPRGWSAAVPYTIWLVFGIYCGLHAYNLAGRWESPKAGGQDWSARTGARRLGNVILVTAVALLAITAWLFNTFLWNQNVSADDYYVPDSAPHSMIFLLSVLAGLLLARFAFMVEGKTQSAEK